jgi:regulator of replication initiation timing
MKIVSLRAENVKRLVAVEITPTGNVVEITGKNGNGKTSVLDAIWWAICGAGHIQGKPIRKGEGKALIELDLGELRVKRTFTSKDGGDYTTALTVTNAEGLKFSKPQDVLDNLIDSLAFDPLDFARSKPVDQLAMLRRFVPSVDFELIELQNKTDYDRRAILNRAVRDYEGAMAAVEVPQVDNEDMEVDVQALESQLLDAVMANGSIETRKVNRERAQDQIDAMARNMWAKRTEADKLEEAAKALRAEADKLALESVELKSRLDAAGPLPDRVDTAKLRAEVDAARARNELLSRRTARVAERNRYQKLTDEAKAAADKHTAARDERIAARDKAIAEASIPVPGITFGDGEVLMNGVPFNQASDAEQLRASVAIAMAGNPKLRVIRIRDGSLLDSASMAMLAEMADKSDMQVWIEQVTDGENVGIVIEDGHVKAFADEPTQK